MLKKICLTLLTALFVFSTAACGTQDVEAEIKLPILENAGSDKFTTATVERRDFVETKSVGGNVGYVYAQTLVVPGDSNLLEYNVRKNDKLKEGDVIAVFDSSALDYDYKNQKILVDDAYAAYTSSGSELSSLIYQQEKLRLDEIQSRIDAYTIRAPYDCIVTKTESLSIGQAIEGGKAVCDVAKEDEVFVYTGDNVNLFSTGTSVKLKFGTDKAYSGKVVMTPDGNSRRGGINSSAVIAFDEGELEKILEEVGNIVSAGWVTIIPTVVEKYNVLAVPEEAVMQFSGSTYCYIMDNGNRVRIPVEVGETYSGYTIILSGLSEGDTVSY